MTALVESACEAALSASDGQRQTLIFCGETEKDATRNLHAAAKHIGAKIEDECASKISFLKVFHQKARDDDGSTVPYQFHFLKSKNSDKLELKLQISSVIEYSDELMLPAALLYGSPRDIVSVLRLSDVNGLKIPIKMIHESSQYKDFNEEVYKLFSELKSEECLLLLSHVVAAILHIKSGNMSIAEDLLGLERSALANILADACPDENTLCNALFHSAAELIIATILRNACVWDKDSPECITLIGVVNKYSKGDDWTDFCNNYQSDMLHLIQSQIEPTSATKQISNGANTSASVSKDFNQKSRDVLNRVMDITGKRSKIYHLYDILTYKANLFKEQADFVEVYKRTKMQLINKKWNCVREQTDIPSSQEFCGCDWKVLLETMDTKLHNIASSRVLSLHCSNEESNQLRDGVYCASPTSCKLCSMNKSMESGIEMQMAMLSEGSPEEDLDLKSPAKKMIKEFIEVNFLDVKRVQALVAQSLKVELSQLDINFICKKYVKYCLQLWLTDSLKLCERVDGENFQQYLDALDDFHSLTHDVPSLFAFSQYLPMLQNVSSLITKRKEREFLQNFKREFQHFLLELNEGIRNELQFIHTFVSFIRSFKDVQKLALDLKLKEFCNEELSFAEFKVTLQTSSLLEEGLGMKTNSRLKMLDDSNHFTQMQKLKHFVSKYITPPETLSILTDGKYFLQTKSMVIELEKILSDVKQHIASNPNIYEVRLIVGDTLYLDADMDKDIFHGLNVVIWCQKLVVFNSKVKIDVSGNDCDKVHPESPGQHDDGKGVDGKDGFRGESGGNIIVMATEIVNAENLLIVSNGGMGGKGQNGGDGRNGNDGVGMSAEKLKNEYPSPLRFFGIGCDGVSQHIKKLKEFAETSKENYDNMNSSYYLKRETNDGMEITYNHDNWVYGSMSAVFLCKGSFGKPGSDGGFNGLGGEGGFGGDVDVGEFREYLMVKVSKGENGKPGESGFNGKPGKNAWDIGYSDFCNWRQPEYSGLAQDSKYKIETYSGSASDRTWCAQLKSYIKLVNTDKIINNSMTMKQQQQKQTERTTRQAQATAPI